MAVQPWGERETQYFYEITPDVVLGSVELALGRRCTGRIMALNSMENRVYEVELESDDPKAADRFVIAKFYRPGRWSAAQIGEEHSFLAELVSNEVPVIAPLKSSDGTTLHQVKDVPILFTLFAKARGRTPQELEPGAFAQVGRLLARMHAVGASRPANERVRLTPTTYGTNNLQVLLEGDWIPAEIRTAYVQVVEDIVTHSEPLFAGAKMQRIHGDCHLGNLLWSHEGFFWVDFDDMVVGPPVQDVWLLLPGRDEYAREALDGLLDAYESMWDFDRSTLALIEPLRALRFVHFSAWIAKRWQDPYFPRAFPHFNTGRYWYEQLNDLREQLSFITEGTSPLVFSQGN